jgi:hypothetical protein
MFETMRSVRTNRNVVVVVVVVVVVEDGDILKCCLSQLVCPQGSHLSDVVQ